MHKTTTTSWTKNTPARHGECGGNDMAPLTFARAQGRPQRQGEVQMGELLDWRLPSPVDCWEQHEREMLWYLAQHPFPPPPPPLLPGSKRKSSPSLLYFWARLGGEEKTVQFLLPCPGAEWGAGTAVAGSSSPCRAAYLSAVPGGPWPRCFCSSPVCFPQGPGRHLREGPVSARCPGAPC